MMDLPYWIIRIKFRGIPAREPIFLMPDGSAQAVVPAYAKKFEDGEDADGAADLIEYGQDRIILYVCGFDGRSLPMLMPVEYASPVIVGDYLVIGGNPLKMKKNEKITIF